MKQRSEMHTENDQKENSQTMSVLDLLFNKVTVREFKDFKLPKQVCNYFIEITNIYRILEKYIGFLYFMNKLNVRLFVCVSKSFL